MTDGDVVAYLNGCLLIEGVQARAVLNVDAVADTDVVDVAAHYGIEPHAAVVAHHDIAHYGSVFGEVTVMSELGRHAQYCFDNCHFFVAYKGCVASISQRRSASSSSSGRSSWRTRW